MPIHANELGLGEAIFTFVAEGLTTHFAVDRLNRHCREQKLEIFRVPVKMRWVEMIQRDRGIEQHRLARLRRRDCRRPLLFCHWSDGTQVLVDGNHRYVWLGLHGGAEALAWIVPEEVWRPFTIVGFEDVSPQQLQQLKSMFSGIV